MPHNEITGAVAVPAGDASYFIININRVASTPALAECLGVEGNHKFLVGGDAADGNFAVVGT